jgi:hypothetical protein
MRQVDNHGFQCHAGGSAVFDPKKLRELYARIQGEPDRARFLALLDEILMLLEMKQLEENKKAHKRDDKAS